MNRSLFWTVTGASVAAVFAYKAIRRSMDEARRLAHEDELIHQAGDESFPASDPPSFTPTGGSNPAVRSAF
jgi:hypothetical protein